MHRIDVAYVRTCIMPPSILEFTFSRRNIMPESLTPRSEKHEQARAALPLELQPVFDSFVDDYRFYAINHYNKPFISYAVLSDMVAAGWRPSARQKP